MGVVSNNWGSTAAEFSAQKSFGYAWGVIPMMLGMTVCFGNNNFTGFGNGVIAQNICERNLHQKKPVLDISTEIEPIIIASPNGIQKI